MLPVKSCLKGSRVARRGAKDSSSDSIKGGLFNSTMGRSRKYRGYHYRCLGPLRSASLTVGSGDSLDSSVELAGAGGSRRSSLDGSLLRSLSGVEVMRVVLGATRLLDCLRRIEYEKERGCGRIGAEIGKRVHRVRPFTCPLP